MVSPCPISKGSKNKFKHNRCRQSLLYPIDLTYSKETLTTCSISKMISVALLLFPSLGLALLGCKTEADFSSIRYLSRYLEASLYKCSIISLLLLLQCNANATMISLNTIENVHISVN